MGNNCAKLVAHLGAFDAETLGFGTNADGSIIVIGPEKGAIEVWDVATSSCMTKIDIPSEELNVSQQRKIYFSEWNKPYSIAISDDGLFVAASFQQTGNIYIWTFEGELLGSFKGNSIFAREVCFFPSSSLLVIVLRDTQLQLWDASIQKLHAVLPGVEHQQTSLLSRVGHFYHIACSPDGLQIALDFTDKENFISLLVTQMRIGKIGYKKQSSFFWSDSFYSKQMKFRNGSQQIYHIGKKYIEYYDISTGKFTAIKYGSIRPVCFCFSPQGKFLAFADYDGLIYIWDIEEEILVSQFNAIEQTIPHYSHYDKSIHWMKWLPQSNLLATAGIERTDGSGRSTVRLWQTNF